MVETLTFAARILRLYIYIYIYTEDVSTRIESSGRFGSFGPRQKRQKKKIITKMMYGSTTATVHDILLSYMLFFRRTASPARRRLRTLQGLEVVR